jgi:hypothetical protein
MAKLLSVGAYVDGIREYSIQAQYFRSPYDYSVRRYSLAENRKSRRRA